MSSPLANLTSRTRAGSVRHSIAGALAIAHGIAGWSRLAFLVMRDTRPTAAVPAEERELVTIR
jgi:hypothetical protein